MSSAQLETISKTVAQSYFNTIMENMKALQSLIAPLSTICTNFQMVILNDRQDMDSNVMGIRIFVDDNWGNSFSTLDEFVQSYLKEHPYTTQEMKDSVVNIESLLKVISTLTEDLEDETDFFVIRPDKIEYRVSFNLGKEDLIFENED